MDHGSQRDGLPIVGGHGSQHDGLPEPTAEAAFYNHPPTYTREQMVQYGSDQRAAGFRAGFSEGEGAAYDAGWCDGRNDLIDGLVTEDMIEAVARADYERLTPIITGLPSWEDYPHKDMVKGMAESMLAALERVLDRG